MHIVFEVLILLFGISWSYFEALFRLLVPHSAKNVRGKVVLVTGAGRGIGRQIDIKFAEHGVKLALLDLDGESARETAELVTSSTVVAVGYTCDVSDVKNVTDVAEKIRQDLGEVDILVNNAGVFVGKRLLQLDETEIRRTMDINALSQFWTIKEFLPPMLKRKSGHIVCIGSMAAKTGAALMTDYGASKFALDGLYEHVEAELHYMGEDHIQLTTVYPMVVNTKLVSDISHRCAYKHRMNPMSEPVDVAKDIVDGVLRNHRYIYIPGYIKSVTWTNFILTRKAKQLLTDFMSFGFVDNHQ